MQPLILLSELKEMKDVSVLFALLGQVRDRLLYHVSDIKEEHVPALLDWILKQCDLNKDVEIDDISSAYIS